MGTSGATVCPRIAAIDTASSRFGTAIVGTSAGSVVGALIACGVDPGVAARSGTDVWVAGALADDAGAPALAHWDGTGWSVTPAPATDGVGIPTLTAVTAADATTAWAVGARSDGTTGRSSAIAFRVAG